MPVYSSEFWSNPFGTYEALRKEFGDVVPIILPNGVEGWLVIGYDTARGLLHDPRLSKNSQYAGPNWHTSHPNTVEGTSRPVFRHMLTMDPPEHTRLRAIVQKHFTRRRVEDMRPRIEKLAGELIDDIAHANTIDLIDHFAVPLPLRFICELLGVPLSDEKKFREWSRLLVTPELEERHLIPRVAEELREYLTSLATMPSEDHSLFSALISHYKGGELTIDELVSMGFLLLVAGHETSVNLIASGTLAALRNRDVWLKLSAGEIDPQYIVEEFLRLDSPIDWAPPRFAREPINVAGERIAAGDTVFIGISAANRDPKQFRCPHMLEQKRPELASHLAFGHGIHFCLGAPLARLEGEISFKLLSQRFPSMQLVKAPEELQWRPGPIMRGLRSLEVRL
ncbi:hypothetical protein ATY76_22430 [Rhizobium sp. R339]|nr:hypothetical protein ATY76_22430 [Rhizobium sp. R339]